MIDALVDAQCKEAGWALPDRETRLIPSRKFRWDYCWRAERIVLEIDGGIWHKGGHSSGAGITRDMEKGNYAAAYGYLQLRLTPKQLRAGGLILWLQMLSLNATPAAS